MAHLDRVFRSNLKLRHLQLVVALDEFRHLGRTAEFMAVSQPAVSRMLSEVEAMLGLALFDRSVRGTEPTPAGHAVVRFARGVLAQYERTRDEIDAAASGAAGKTRVGAMAVAMPVLLARAVRALKARSARATVQIEEGDLTHLLPKLRLGELDLFVGRLEPGYAAPDLQTEALFDEPMVAIAAPGSPIAGMAQPEWADLAALPCVMPPPWASLRVKLEQQFHRHGLQPSSDLMETSSYLATLTFVGERGGVGFLAQSAARRFERQGLCRILDVPLSLALPPVGIITLRGAGLPAASVQLIECLREAAAQTESGAG
ncbi:LysR substrate-binding domain-containing protein [Achromobacter arsenitoxydans]|uniref:LysR family transcriptional regulator n=1 Tax=Achromobacter arsenitoxydans SY8 TaxID=477184 RepID=H0F8H5_9BURK|nr:LysR substrate-binding domain-containing protein [Achromobacter arsenitoxydans]EHK65608.1 LysR family transcriptional regulator [Achromobacter arsenitoxydans SY8]